MNTWQSSICLILVSSMLISCGSNDSGSEPNAAADSDTSSALIPTPNRPAVAHTNPNLLPAISDPTLQKESYTVLNQALEASDIATARMLLKSAATNRYSDDDLNRALDFHVRAFDILHELGEKAQPPRDVTKLLNTITVDNVYARLRNGGTKQNIDEAATALFEESVRLKRLAPDVEHQLKILSHKFSENPKFDAALDD